MGLTGTTLLLVSLAFIGSAAAHNCQNGTRPASEEKREGCDFYCWNTDTKSWDKFFLRERRTNALTTMVMKDYVKNGEMPFDNRFRCAQ
uniref:Putative secreted protein with basic tail n=1 Tax=Ixodes ricinus TaxID=34613 RepID=A0A090X7Z2_IXORI